jgi:hypothetical protein
MWLLSGECAYIKRVYYGMCNHEDSTISSFKHILSEIRYMHILHLRNLKLLLKNYKIILNGFVV